MNGFKTFIISAKFSASRYEVLFSILLSLPVGFHLHIFYIYLVSNLCDGQSIFSHSFSITIFRVSI